MASTPNHAVQGAVLMCLMLKALHWILFLTAPVFTWLMVPFTPIVCAVFATLGAVLGALPDIIGWMGRIVEPFDWTLYGEAHSGSLARILKRFPPYWLHLKVDTFFHTEANHGHWWPSLWWMEAGFWIVNGLLAWWLL